MKKLNVFWMITNSPDTPQIYEKYLSVTPASTGATINATQNGATYSVVPYGMQNIIYVLKDGRFAFILAGGLNYKPEYSTQIVDIVSREI